MEDKQVKLESLRYFGKNGPIAILSYQGKRCAYTLDGIESLIQVNANNSNATESLSQIKEAIIRARRDNEATSPDIGPDDFSGQNGLFPAANK